MNLPRLTQYTKETRPGPAYWTYWPINKCKVGKSRIDGAKMMTLANTANYPYKNVLKQAHIDLVEGAKIGCEGRFREVSDSTNAPSAYE